MNPIIKYSAAVAITLAALSAAYMGGVHVTKQEYEAIIDANAKNAAEAQTKAVFDARTDERASVAAQALIDRQLLENANHEITERDNTIAGLHAGSIRLRDRFTCPASTGGVSTASTSTGSGDAASTSGLQKADAEFLIRFADESDQAALKLQACQAVVRADRGGK